MAAIAALHPLGVEVAMITGDNATTAAAIARRVGCPGSRDAARAQRRRDPPPAGRGPQGREGRRRDQRRPAPAAADVGLAIGTGTEMANEAAGITLISGSVAEVVRAIALPRATMRNAQTRLTCGRRAHHWAMRR